MEVSGIKAFRNSPYVVTSSIGMFSIVHHSEQDVQSIGPDSVDVPSDALVFGGSVLTCLDVGVAANLISMGDPGKVKDLSRDLVEHVLLKFGEMIADLIDKTKESSKDIPGVFLGFGSTLIIEQLPGISQLVKPQHYEFAEAVGAAVMPKKESTRGRGFKFAFGYFGAKGKKKTPVGGGHNYPHAFRFELSSRKDHNLYLRDRALKSSVRQYVLSEPQFTGIAGINVSDKPNINSEGEWLLSEKDLDLLSIGVGILGSGGGGSPDLGKLMGLQQLKKGKKIRVKVPERLGAGETTMITALMGSPAVFLEKYPNGSEGTDSLQSIKDLYKCGYKQDGDNWSIAWKPAGTVLQDDDKEDITYDQDFPIVYNPPHVDNIGAMIPVESGGANTLQALVVASQAGLPVLDCDGEGRAVPSLQMIGPAMYGQSLYPASVSGDKGQRVVAFNGPSAGALESFFRDQVVAMGSYAAVSFAPMPKTTVENYTVKYTISKAWRIGEKITTAKKENKDPIQSVVDYENGKVLIKDGKVTEIDHRTVGGFDRGVYTIADGKGNQVAIDFQNENLVVWDKGPENKKHLASIPDIISVVDTEGNGLTTELLHFGLRVSVIALPCSPLLTSTQALKFIGPRALGYDFDYKPIGKYRQAVPVPPLP
ncbi:uncharacterized protein [Amphiura filiformis]|uniref:uncharacterized protein n=1 Tax=Amphiura filiformis TaxID=82378 RepID=UPI003B21CFEE